MEFLEALDHLSHAMGELGATGHATIYLDADDFHRVANGVEFAFRDRTTVATGVLHEMQVGDITIRKRHRK